MCFLFPVQETHVQCSDILDGMPNVEGIKFLFIPKCVRLDVCTQASAMEKCVLLSRFVANANNHLFVQGMRCVFNDSYVHLSLLAEKNLVHCSEEIKQKKVANFTNGLAYILQRKQEVDIDYISELHALVMDGLLESAGCFRKTNVKPAGSAYTYMHFSVVERELSDLCKGVQNILKQGGEPVSTCCVLLERFLFIHLFDGKFCVTTECFPLLATFNVSH